MTALLAPELLLEVFAETATAVGGAVNAIPPSERRGRTDTPGQYALDLVADAAARTVLSKIPVRLLSEESSWTGTPDAEVTVVIDPVDGSTNCSRDIPYYATAITAMVNGELYVSLVQNLVTGTVTTATPEGAWRNGEPIRTSGVQDVQRSIVAVSGLPSRHMEWKQFRALGSCALALCDLAAGLLDAYVDTGRWHRPWDYLGGLHACTHAGAAFIETHGEELIVAEDGARRGMLVAATAELLDELRPMVPGE